LRLFTALKNGEIKLIMQNTREISRITLWENLIEHYYRAYDLGSRKAEPRIKELPAPEPVEHLLAFTRLVKCP
jgi:hypothetical protein